MTMCTVKEIQEAIREDCRSQHDMDSTDIDRVMQTLPFAKEEPVTGGIHKSLCSGSMQENLKSAEHRNSLK